MVCNRQDEDPIPPLVALDAIDDAVGEARNQEPANLGQHLPPNPWMMPKALERMLDLIQQHGAQPLGLCLVKGRCLEELPPGERVP